MVSHFTMKPRRRQASTASGNRTPMGWIEAVGGKLCRTKICSERSDPPNLRSIGYNSPYAYDQVRRLQT